jgi:hypothetical protein
MIESERLMHVGKQQLWADDRLCLKATLITQESPNINNIKNEKKEV